VRQLRPDVLHANHFVPVQAGLANRVPVVLTLHSDILSWQRWTRGTLEVTGHTAWYRKLVQGALCQATAVTAVSEFLAREIADLYAVPGQIQVIHNGYPVASAPSGHRPRATFMAGRVWDPAKNLAAVAPVARAYRVGPVLLAGEQRHPETGALADVPAPFERLGFLDPPALMSELARARVYLSPARYDPFGLLPLQAALQGCALLLSDIPSYREIWGDAAGYFPLEAPDMLGSRWLEMLAAPQEYAARARARAETRYTAPRMAAAYRTLYARVAARQLVEA
jgi:glycosyltransferase involved in cell wall biosynthesis